MFVYVFKAVKDSGFCQNNIILKGNALLLIMYTVVITLQLLPGVCSMRN